MALRLQYRLFLVSCSSARSCGVGGVGLVLSSVLSGNAIRLEV